MQFKALSLSRFLLIAALAGACSTPAPEPTATPAPTAAAAPTPTPAPTVTAAPGPAPTASAGDMTLTSLAFAEGERIPDPYTYRLPGQCDGDNLSPQLSWTGLPAGTLSLALIMRDPGGGNFKHWVQYNIQANITELPETVDGPDLGLKGRNGFGKDGYAGPCPPGGTHRYIFTLYALDSMLPLEGGATTEQVTQAMEGHILAQVQLSGVR
jgi:Raf kinase inhibitor-like YbhB/YbcL family protein